VDARNALHRGYNPNSSQDVLDRDDDIIPSSLRTDAIHFNDIGHGVVADAVYQKLAERGW
jgi:lysophospholipase L1-like esterase